MPNALADAQVNLFADTYKPIPIHTLTLAQALEDIRTGAYARQVAYVRRMLTRGEASYRAAKNRLPAFTFAGTFSPSRLIANLQQHSGIVHADLDHIQDVVATKQAIGTDPRTVYAFISPRGDGLKFGVRVPVVPDDSAYKHAWQTIATDYEQRYGGIWDQTGKDISRLCYVSYDPELYLNCDAAVFDVPPPHPPTPAPTPEPWLYRKTERRSSANGHYDPQTDVERALRTATEMIRTAQMGSRHHTRLKASRLLGGYVGAGLLSESEAYDTLASALEGYTEHLSAALKTVKDGLAYGRAAPFSLTALEADWQRWVDTHQPKPPTDDAPWEWLTPSYHGYRGYRAYRGYRKGTVSHG